MERHRRVLFLECTWNRVGLRILIILLGEDSINDVFTIALLRKISGRLSQLTFQPASGVCLLPHTDQKCGLIQIQAVLA
jgi:hypothetical protein